MTKEFESKIVANDFAEVKVANEFIEKIHPIMSCCGDQIVLNSLISIVCKLAAAYDFSDEQFAKHMNAAFLVYKEQIDKKSEEV